MTALIVFLIFAAVAMLGAISFFVYTCSTEWLDACDAIEIANKLSELNQTRKE